MIVSLEADHACKRGNPNALVAFNGGIMTFDIAMYRDGSINKAGAYQNDIRYVPAF